jgi:hypothetical protein
MALSAAHSAWSSSQDFRSGMSGSRNPRQDRPERAWIAADLRHQRHAISVGARLDLAGIARLQNSLGGEYHGAAADEIPEQHSEQKRQAGALQHRSRPVAVSNVPDFMGDDAGELVRCPGFIDQALKDQDVTTGKRDGI